jgi:cyclopropane-fatty-acyl-phospholipid synthase
MTALCSTAVDDVQTFRPSQEVLRGFTMFDKSLRTWTEEILCIADVKIDGDRSWDIAVHNENFYRRVLRQGSLGLGESYMDGWWDCGELDQLVLKILAADLRRKIPFHWMLFPNPKVSLFNPQRKTRAARNASRHYDLGNDLYQIMLDKRMVYSCANWACASNLDEAQEAKLNFVCQKLRIEPGMKVLDIGCGWGSFAKYAAEKHGAEVVGITVSEQQVRLGKQMCAGLPIEIHFQDYRSVSGQFDRIVSLGMFEHVGHQNYRTYMEVVHRCLKTGGLFFLGSIGTNQSAHFQDAWVERYIFPGGMLPSIKLIGAAIEGLFVMEEWQNWGNYYDQTLMAWFKNFQENWERIRSQYDERFYRMWKYYLLSYAASFRARNIQAWQVVLSPR